MIRKASLISNIVICCVVPTNILSAADEVPVWKVQVIGGNGVVTEELGPYYSDGEAEEAEQRWI